MGYTTNFKGTFKLNKPLTEAQAKYINTFSETRRMKRDVDKTSKISDPIREAVKLPLGVEGQYFVGGRGFFGQDDDSSVIEHNTPPEGQAGIWCQWVVNPDDPDDTGDTGDNTLIGWDGGEKFYEYTKWLTYIIDHFLKPWGYILNGQVEYQGEEIGDHGMITVKNNKVSSDE